MLAATTKRPMSPTVPAPAAERRPIGWDDASPGTRDALLDWVAHSGDPVVALGDDGRIRHANPAYERVFGPPADDAPALSAAVPLLTAQRLSRWLAEAAGGARAHRLLAEGVGPDGERFLVAATLLRIAAPDASPDDPSCLVSLRPMDAPRGVELGPDGRAPRDAVRLPALVDAALRSMPAADRRRVDVALHAPDATLPVDPEALRHALVALLSNAMRFSPPETPVALRSREDACDDADWIVLTVSDRGIGMSRAQQSRAFDPFWRASDAGPGQGLGLATARRLVEAAGGWIELRSVLGVGTDVEVWLPAAD